jgi:glycosyltransferase involved in cell wall biosynthesis
VTIVITRRESLQLPDGINIFLFTLADALIQRGHCVVAVSTCRVSEARVRETFRCDKYPELVSITESDQLGYLATGLAWMRFGRRVVASYCPTLVIVNGAVPVKLPGCMVIVSHDLERRVPRFRMLRILYKAFCYRLADRIVATCTEVADALAAEIRIQRSRIRIIPTCMNVENYAPKDLSKRLPLILHMGTVDYKNPLTTLRAFAELKIDAGLQITGPVTPEINDFIDNLDLETRSRISVGRFLTASELKELLESARIVSVPSDYAVPVASPTVLESFAAGTPVVCSPSISRDVIRQDESGIVAETPQAVAEAFDRLLHDDTMWQKFSERARSSMVKFSAQTVAAEYERVATE